MAEPPLRTLYWSFAPPDVYRLLRAELPPQEVTLLTLRADTPEERTRLLAEADAVIVAAHPIAAADIAGAPRLRLVHHQGVGWEDTVPAPALAVRGIRLALTPSGTTTGVAEHTLLLILAALRRLSFADAELRKGRFHINALRPASRELAELTVGLLGFGRIGRAVAQRLGPFGCRVLVTDPAPGTLEAALALGAEAVTFDQLLADADVLSLHLPGKPGAPPVIGAAEIARMKPAAVLVNTARGSLLDEAALARALEEGRLGAAALDVFAPEPPLPDNPLLRSPATVLTPHIAAGTRDALAAKFRAIGANLARFRRGEPLSDEVPLASAVAASA